MSSYLLEQRREGLGGTDASAVLGLNPWRTPLQVWCDKRGLTEPQEQTEAMRWGLIMEPVIAARYAEVTGRALWAPEQVYHHKEHDFLLGTPDRICADKTRGLEVKTASAYVADQWGREGTDEVPPHYLIQCAHYMALTGINFWDVAVLIGGNDFRIYTVKRDRELEASLVTRCAAWWQRHMVEGIEPAAVAADNGFVQRWFPKNDLTMKAESVEAYALAAERKLAVAALAEAQDRKDEAEAQLKVLIGEADGIQGEGWSVTWKKNKDGGATDWRAAIDALAGSARMDAGEVERIIQNHTTTKPGPRVFRYSEKDATK